MLTSFHAHGLIVSTREAVKLPQVVVEIQPEDGDPAGSFLSGCFFTSHSEVVLAAVHVRKRLTCTRLVCFFHLSTLSSLDTRIGCVSVTRRIQRERPDALLEEWKRLSEDRRDRLVSVLHRTLPRLQRPCLLQQHRCVCLWVRMCALMSIFADLV